MQTPLKLKTKKSLEEVSKFMKMSPAVDDLSRFDNQFNTELKKNITYLRNRWAEDARRKLLQSCNKTEGFFENCKDICQNDKTTNTETNELLKYLRAAKNYNKRKYLTMFVILTSILISLLFSDLYSNMSGNGFLGNTNINEFGLLPMDNTSKTCQKLYTEILETRLKYSRNIPDLTSKVLSTPGTTSYGKIWKVAYFLGVPTWLFYETRDPSLMLQPWKKPGDCWAFYGKKGKAVISLKGKTLISHVSLEHILEPDVDRSTAPYEFELRGIVGEDREIWLGSFYFDKSGPAIQMFKVCSQNSQFLFNKVLLSILSNHGNLKHTCVYRFKVHGHLI